MAEETPASPPTPTPTASVEQLSGGVTRVTPSGDPEGQAAREAAAANVASPELETKEEGAALPEGYDSWEAYGKAVAAGTAKAPEAKPAEGEGGKTPEAAPEVPPELAAKLEPFDKELTEKGALSDESVAKAAKEFGVTEEMVRAYVAGLQSSQAAQIAPFYEQTGGAEGYKSFQEWSATGMSAEEQKTLNAAYEAGDPAVALALQKTFVDRWKAEGNGKPPVDLTAEAKNGGAPSGGDAYESWEQLKADQSNPLYAKDPAFRAKVEAKVARSPNL